MRQLIFKRLSSTTETQFTKIIENFTDVKKCEQLLLDYQAAVYGPQDNTLIACPSVRLNYINQDNYPVDTLLINIKALLSILNGLHITNMLLQKEYKRQLFWKRLLGRFSYSDPDSYARAYGRVTRTYKSILFEANLLGQALSSKLLDWYQAKKPLARSKLEEYAYASNLEPLFFNACKQLADLQSINKCWIKEKNRFGKSATSFKPKTDDTATSNAPALDADQQRFEQITHASLKAVGIAPQQLNTLIRQQQSFWKNNRYKARLFFLRMCYRRHLQEQQDIIPTWQSLKQHMQQVKQCYSKLNSLFQRSLKKLYKRLENEMRERCITLAITGLKELMGQSNLLEHYNRQETTINLWVKQLPTTMQEYWNTMLEGLLNPNHVNPDNWKRAIHAIYDYLNISITSEHDLLKNWVQQYIIRHVKSKKHPAYPLIAQYTNILIEEPARCISMAPPEEPVHIILIKRVSDAAYLSIERLHHLSRETPRQQLPALVGLSLTQGDLSILVNIAGDVIQSHQHYEPLLSQLRFISNTLFASPSCQEQAQLILDILSSQPLERRKIIARRYLDLATTQAMHATSLFNQIPRRHEGSTHSDSTLHYRPPSQEIYHAS